MSFRLGPGDATDPGFAAALAPPELTDLEEGESRCVRRIIVLVFIAFVPGLLFCLADANCVRDRCASANYSGGYTYLAAYQLFDIMLIRIMLLCDGTESSQALVCLLCPGAAGRVR